MMNITLPLYKIDNYKEIEDLDYNKNSPSYIYYKYLNSNLQNIWEIKPFAKKNILEINFKSPEIGKFDNILFISLEGLETIEIPILIECITDFIDFGLYFEKQKVFL